MSNFAFLHSALTFAPCVDVAMAAQKSCVDNIAEYRQTCIT